MRIQVTEDVKYIIEKLNSAGYEAYAVGGCVRDSILGRIPFKGVKDIITGEEFGTTVDSKLLSQVIENANNNVQKLTQNEDIIFFFAIKFFFHQI